MDSLHSSPPRCAPCSPLSWWLAWSAWATGLALASSAVALRSASAMPRPWCWPARSRLLQLHVRTLRLNPHAGQKPPYAMRGPTLALVKSD